MGFPGPLFSDSGGFQAFSLGFGREHNISKIGNIFPQETSCYEENDSVTEGAQKKKENSREPLNEFSKESP